MILNSTYFRNTAIIISLSSLCIGALYAAGMFPSLSTPSGNTPNGSFSIRFTNISQSCPAKYFVKGFDANFNPLCVVYNAPNSASSNVPLANFSAPITNGLRGGKFGTYFNNLLNTCSTNGIVKGFNSQGGKICVNALDRTTPTDSPNPTTFSAMRTPATPSGETTGGSFQSYFTKMFTTCGLHKGVTGISADGTPTCGTIPLDGICGSSGGGNFSSSTEISNPCSKGTQSAFLGSGPWSWTCSGQYGGNTASCSTAPSTNSCAANPTFSNLGALTIGSPSSAGQPWTYGAANCGYECASGYSGVGCTCSSASGCTTAPANYCTLDATLDCILEL